MAKAAALIGDRWALLILRELFYGVTRFADIEADISAPRAVLSQRLRALVDAGLLERIPYKEEGARTRHEYALAPKARDLATVVAALTEWGDRHLREDAAPVEFVERATGTTLRLAFATASGRVVEPAGVTMRFKSATERKRVKSHRSE